MKRLQAMSAKSGLSLSEIARRNLDGTEAKFKEAYDRGFEDGLALIEVPCAICGELIQIDVKSREDARATLEAAFSAWRHRTCPE